MKQNQLQHGPPWFCGGESCILRTAGHRGNLRGYVTVSKAQLHLETKAWTLLRPGLCLNEYQKQQSRQRAPALASSVKHISCSGGNGKVARTPCPPPVCPAGCFYKMWLRQRKRQKCNQITNFPWPVAVWPWAKSQLYNNEIWIYLFIFLPHWNGKLAGVQHRSVLRRWLSEKSWSQSTVTAGPLHFFQL